MGKSKPISVRFEEDQLGLIKRLEKLDTPQKVVNFLLADYWWKHRHQMDAQKVATAAIPYISQQVPKSVFEGYQEEISAARNLEDLNKTGTFLEKDSGLTSAQRATLREQCKVRSKTLEL